MTEGVAVQTKLSFAEMKKKGFIGSSFLNLQNYFVTIYEDDGFSSALNEAAGVPIPFAFEQDNDSGNDFANSDWNGVYKWLTETQTFAKQ